MVKTNSFDRYIRQTGLENFGIKSQNKLLNSKVLIVGLGGTGSLILEYLIRMGVGTLGLVDFDDVHISNLHRQILYTEKDLNKRKIEVLKNYLPLINNSTSINYINDKLTDKNIEKIMSNYDLIIDAVDVLKTKFLLNKYSVKLKIPLIFSSVSSYKGQVLFINNKMACLECLLGPYQDFTNTKKTELENKVNFVFSPTIGIISSIITALAIKYLVGTEIKKKFFLIKEDFSVKNYTLKSNDTCFCQKYKTTLNNLKGNL